MRKFDLDAVRPVIIRCARSCTTRVPKKKTVERIFLFSALMRVFANFDKINTRQIVYIILLITVLLLRIFILLLFSVIIFRNKIFGFFRS